VPLAAPLDEQLAYCATHVLRVARRDGMWVVPDDAPEKTIAAARLMKYRDHLAERRRSGGALRTARRKLRTLARATWWGLTAYIERGRLHLSSPQQSWREYVFSPLAWVLVAARLMVLSCLRFARKLVHPLVRLLRAVARFVVTRSETLRFFLIDLPNARAWLQQFGYAPTLGELLDELQLRWRRVPAVHSNACGDFILTDRASWHRMHGSPELAIFSFHLDSLTLINAIKAGGSLVDLAPVQVIYHIEHGSGWTPEHNLSMYRRINRAGIPVLSNGGYARYATNLLRDPKYFLATEDWGLAQMNLAEVVVTPRVEAEPTRADRETWVSDETAAKAA
jgi:hypothetical protein